MQFRTLRPNEIDIRVARATAKGAQFLLYKDARCDMAILDETVGAENWQRKHDEHNGNLFCSVGIHYKELDEWIWKEDAGSESNTEAEKGHASDSFKRACVNWGIGRELYTSPLVWIDGCTEKDDKGRFVPKKEYKYLFVSDIEYDNKRTIIKLVISNKSGVVYSFGKSAPKANKPTQTQPKEEPLNYICADCKEPVKPVKKRDGEMWEVADMAKYSELKYKRCLCANCMKKADALRKMRESGNAG